MGEDNDMVRALVIENNTVVNAIVVSDDFVCEDGSIVVTDEGQIGWLYSEGKFIAPVIEATSVTAAQDINSKIQALSSQIEELKLLVKE